MLTRLGHRIDSGQPIPIYHTSQGCQGHHPLVPPAAGGHGSVDCNATQLDVPVPRRPQQLQSHRPTARTEAAAQGGDVGTQPEDAWELNGFDDCECAREISGRINVKHQDYGDNS